MPKNNSTIDGFVPRRRGSDNAASSMYGLQPHSAEGEAAHITLKPHDTVNTTEISAGDSGLSMQSTASSGLSRNDIDQSLGDIDTEEETPKRAAKARKHPHKKRHIVRWVVIAIVVIALGFGGFLGIKAILASSKIFKGNIFGVFQHQALKEDNNGRSNIIVFGTSEDDGPDHGGAYLTDSMMVVSIDQKKHNMFTFNIPRDLWVNYEGSCQFGNRGKINAVYECNSNDGKDEQPGADAVRKTVSEVTGLDIQYYVHVNYTVVKDAVDAVGGVDVDIRGDGPVPYGVEPGSILDRNFDWNCNYKCYYVKYSPGVHHLDGTHALFLARARGDATPTYGLQRANFDREVNQQKILKALVSKAVSTGTLMNYGAVTGLVDTFGSNLRTNFETSEIQTLIDVAKNTPSKSIQSISLIDANPAILTTDMIDGQSIVRPVTSLFDYTPIANYLARKISSDPAVNEGSKIGIFNGGGVSGSAQKLADKLAGEGLTIEQVGNAGEDITAKYEIYDLSGGKNPATISKLQSAYGVKAITASKPSFATDGLDIVIIIGPSGQTSSSNN